MDKFDSLRKQNPVFVYKNYLITEDNDKITIKYIFEFPGLKTFTPEWEFPKPEGFSGILSEDLTFERLVFSLGMAEAVSYWKAACSPEMRIECGELSAEQIQWWKKLYFLGLGEFFYVNGIDPDFDSFVTINPCGSFRADSSRPAQKLSGCLVPIGGGKDSALTIETLVNAGMNCKGYSINSRCSITATAVAAGIGSEGLITARRRFDRTLLELNSAGYLNGHTPFSSVVAFSAEITAYLHGLKYIVLSNESSANESTVAGQSVNHQYSKSFEFERDFSQYEKIYLGTGISYFSFLRPLTEFQIAKMFVSHEKYLPVFRSCNLGGKVSPDIWCAECPKCLFVCLIISPFVSKDRLTEIFGRDLLNEPDMQQYFKELLGLTEHKPFECVGSIDEVKLAVTLAIRSYEASKTELPLLFRDFVSLGLYQPDLADHKLTEYCSSYNSENLLPEEFEIILKNEMERLL